MRAREVNEFGARTAREHRGRFGHFASLPLPDVTGSIAEAGYALEELASHGLAIETNVDGSYLGEARYAPLWAELERRRAVVFVHPTSPRCAAAVSLGWPRPMLEFIFDSTRTVSGLVFSGVLTRYPHIEWIFTHGGGTLPLLADRIEPFRTVFMNADPDAPHTPGAGPAAVVRHGRHPVSQPDPGAGEGVRVRAPAVRSDYCWTPAAGTTAQVSSLDEAPQPAGDTWRELTTRNALRLLPALTPERPDR